MSGFFQTAPPWCIDVSGHRLFLTRYKQQRCRRFGTSAVAYKVQATAVEVSVHRLLLTRYKQQNCGCSSVICQCVVAAVCSRSQSSKRKCLFSWWSVSLEFRRFLYQTSDLATPELYVLGTECDVSILNWKFSVKFIVSEHMRNIVWHVWKVTFSFLSFLKEKKADLWDHHTYLILT
jgi:hypothetical protein